MNDDVKGMENRIPPVPARLALVIVAAGLLFAGEMLAISGSDPAGVSNYSIPVVLLYGWMDSALGLLVAPTLFLLASIPQVSGSQVPGRAARWAVVAVALFSTLHFLLGWTHGLTYQGWDTVFFWAFTNAAAAIVAFLMTWSRPDAPRWTFTLGARLYLFWWASCWAFPYLGETP